MTLANERQQYLEDPDAYCPFLTANTELFDHCSVTFNILALEVIEQTATLTDDLEQTTSGMVVFFVSPEMIRQIGDAFRKKCNLHLGRPGITLMGFEFLDDFLFAFCGQHGATSLILVNGLLSFSAEPKRSFIYHKS
jgi:hypothetical protein